LIDQLTEREMNEVSAARCCLLAGRLPSGAFPTSCFLVCPFASCFSALLMFFLASRMGFDVLRLIRVIVHRL
jgi:hypothetical protein